MKTPSGDEIYYKGEFKMSVRRADGTTHVHHFTPDPGLFEFLTETLFDLQMQNGMVEAITMEAHNTSLYHVATPTREQLEDDDGPEYYEPDY